MWNKLSMKEKAALIKVAVSNGLTDLDLIKNKYNEFAEGGNTKSSDKEYYSYMEKLATKKAKDWGEHPDITLTHMLNSNDYNYRAFYDNNREEALAMLNADPEAHFTDIGKTVYHPTFSNESIYSGKKSNYNPRGTIGGSWNGLEYIPSKSQLENKDFNYNKTKKYLTNTPEYIDSRYNKFDEGGITTTDVIKTGASFIPFVGTGLDIYDFAKDPSVENGLWVLASLGADLYSAGQGSKAVRVVKLARQAQKAHDIAKMKHLDSVVRRGNKNYTNNLRQFRKQRALAEQSRQLANSHIKNAIKAELIQGLTFNTAQQGYNNKEVLLDMVNNPQNYLDIKALGGPLLNQNNPIESFNGGRRLPVVRYDDGGWAPSTTSIEYHPEDFYELGDDVRFVGEKRVHNPEKSAETDAWYRENAPHYWTLMNKRDKSGFDLETKGLIKDIEKTIYNSGFESYIPEIVVTAKRPIKENTSEQPNVPISTEVDTTSPNVQEILFTAEPSIEVSKNPGRDSRGQYRHYISDFYPANTDSELMELAKNWTNKIVKYHPNISPEDVRNAMDQLQISDWGPAAGDYFSNVLGVYSPGKRTLQSTIQSSVRAHELEHALRDIVLGGTNRASSEEIEIIKNAYPNIQDFSEALATNAEFREILRKNLGMTLKDFDNYISDKTKITDTDIAKVIGETLSAYIDPEDYVTTINEDYPYLADFYSEEGLNEEALRDYIESLPAKAIKRFAPEDSGFRQILNEVNNSYEKAFNNKKQAILNKYGKVREGSKEALKLHKELKALKVELQDNKSRILQEKLKGKEKELFEHLSPIIKEIGEKHYKPVYIKDQKKIDAVRKAMKEIAQNENNNNSNLFFT